jgi:hypothetical protein
VDLKEIEDKADELAERVISTPSLGTTTLHAGQIKALKDLAIIKAAVSQRADYDAAKAMRERELAAMEAVAASNESMAAAYAGATPEAAEPTKPAADRLHELLSYFIQQSEAPINGQTPDTERQGMMRAMYYDDAATKLQEILTEGGI